mgnify:CR=1 FL=1
MITLFFLNIMPNISKKAQTMPASPIRKLVPFSDAAKAKGIEVFHLNIGQPDLETPQLALEAVRNYTERVVKYTPSEGTFILSPMRGVLLQEARKLC